MEQSSITLMRLSAHTNRQDLLHKEHFNFQTLPHPHKKHITDCRRKVSDINNYKYKRACFFFLQDNRNRTFVGDVKLN